MGRRKKAEPDDKEQSERFKEVADQIGSDIDKDEFKRLCRGVLQPKKQKKE